MTAPLLACCLALCGVFAVAAAIGDDPVPPPESIPLSAAAIATPIDYLTIGTVPAPPLTSTPPVSIFPSVPPIRSTPMFVSTQRRPVFVKNHRRVLLSHGYVPPQPDPVAGMN